MPTPHRALPARHTPSPLTSIALPAARHHALARAVQWALAAGAATALSVAATGAHAQAAEQQRSYDIPAGPLDGALRSAAAQAGVALTFTSEQAASQRSNGLRGSYTVDGAFSALLAGTDWQAVRQGNGGYALRRVAVSGAAAGDAATLASVTVMAQAERSGITEATGSYAATGPLTTATRLGLTLRETPQTVSVITRQRLDDQDLATVAEVLDQTPGISVQNIGSNRFSIVSRGYTIDNYQLDGIVTATDIVSQNIPQSQADMVIYDRVEVLRGAAGLLVGAGDPSGTINLVRKKPTREFQGHASVSAGSWQRRRGELDLSAPLTQDSRVRGRVVAAAEEGGTHIDYYDQKKQVVYGVVEADLTDSTLLTVGMDWQKSDPRGGSSTGLPLFYSSGEQTDFAASANAGAQDNINRISATTVFATLDQRLANDWRMKLSGNYLDGKRKVASADASWGFPDRATGGGVMLYGGPGSATQEQKGFDAQVQGPFTLAGRRHEAVLGFNWSEFSNFHDSQTDVNSTEGRAVNLYTWGNQTVMPQAGVGNYMDYDGWQKQYGTYGALRLRPRDDLAVIVGARVSTYHYRLTSVFPGNPAWDAVQKRDESSVFTPYAGIVYDLTPQHALYASYASIFKPQSQRDRNGAVLDPREGDNYEIGVKSAFLNGRVQTAVALYEVRQDNLAEVDTGQIVAGTQSERAYRAVNGARTRGIDLELNGEIASGWNVSASYNYGTTDNAAGTRINTVFPRQMARLWTTYRLGGALHGLTLGGGVNWQDRMYFSASTWQLPGVTLNGQQKGYAVVGLMARYDFDRQWSATLNIHNLFDKKYLQGLDSTFYTGTYAPTRNAMLNVKYQF